MDHAAPHAAPLRTLVGARLGKGPAPVISAIAGTLLSLFVGFGAAMLEPSDRTLLVSAIAVTIILPLALRVAQHRFDLFEPIVIFAVAYGIVFVVRPAAMLGEGNMVYGLAGFSVSIDQTFTEMLLLGLVGAVAFGTGYGLPAGRWIARRTKSPPYEVDASVAAGLAVVFALAGASLFVLFILSSGGVATLHSLLSGRSLGLTQTLRTASKYLYFGPALFVPAVLILWVLGRLRRNKLFLALAVAITSLLLVFSGSLGYRMVLLPLGMGALVYHYTTRRTRPRFVTVVLMTGLALVASNFLLNVRDASVRQERGPENVFVSVVTKPQRAFDPILKGQDAAEAPGFAAALTVVPEVVPHQYGGATVGDLVTRPIPRQLWPKKPTPPRERVIRTLFPRAYAVGAANPEFSGLLAFYLDGGIVGVAIGFALYGVIMRALYDYYRLHEGSMPARLIFATSLAFLVIAVRDTPVDTFSRAAMVVIPIWLAFRLAGPGKTTFPKLLRAAAGRGRVVEAS
jgi:hypothetical protein